MKEGPTIVSAGAAALPGLGIGRARRRREALRRPAAVAKPAQRRASPAAPGAPDVSAPPAKPRAKACDSPPRESGQTRPTQRAPRPETPAVRRKGSSCKATALLLFVAALLVCRAPSRAFDLLDPASWPIIPVPEVVTDPFAGTTVGILPVHLFLDAQQQVTAILAPDLSDNTITGATGNFRYLGFPSADTNWWVTAGASQVIEREVDLFYGSGRLHRDQWSYQGEFRFDRNPTERFFGVGNNTPFSAQTNYTLGRVFGEGRLGYNVTPRLQVAADELIQRLRIGPGALGATLPSVQSRFPNVAGVDGGTELMNRLLLTYDSRDSIYIPHSGTFARVFCGFSQRGFVSSASFNQFGAEAREYVALGDRMTLAAHLYLQYVPGGDQTPFWAMSWLGGDRAFLGMREPLRAYGPGRFIDDNLSVANLELRTWVYEMDIFKTHGILELAPFVEAGQVFHEMTGDPVGQLHPAAGMGFRGIAFPFVVGYVDVGYGSEGAVLFSGINYAF